MHGVVPKPEKAGTPFTVFLSFAESTEVFPLIARMTMRERKYAGLIDTPNLLGYNIPVVYTTGML